MANILICIADADERDQAVFALRFAGHRIQSTATAEELITQVRNSQPDLVITDAHLPGLAESELQSTINISLRSDPIPIVYLVEGDEAANRQLNHDALTADFMIKPISPDQLIHLVKERLKAR